MKLAPFGEIGQIHFFLLPAFPASPKQYVNPVSARTVSHDI